MRSYEELPPFDDAKSLIEGSSARHAWDEHGPGDDLGALNLLTPQGVITAARLVRQGAVFSLDLSLDQPGHGGVSRPTYDHQIIKLPRGRDDALDRFHVSASSQWDGLRHVRYGDHYFGGRTEQDLDASQDLCVDNFANKGFVTRGVLIDVAGFMSVHERGWDPLGNHRVTPELLDEVLADQQVSVESGDVVLVRTGWVEAFMALTPEQLANGPGTIPGMHPAVGTAPGLSSGEETAAWLWNHGVVAVAVDNIAVERTPYADPGDGNLHVRLLPLLGIYMGELFDLKELAADCRGDGVYEGMFVSAPMKIPSGACSPPNAYFIK